MDTVFVVGVVRIKEDWVERVVSRVIMWVVVNRLSGTIVVRVVEGPVKVVGWALKVRVCKTGWVVVRVDSGTAKTTEASWVVRVNWMVGTVRVLVWVEERVRAKSGGATKRRVLSWRVVGFEMMAEKV